MEFFLLILRTHLAIILRIWQYQILFSPVD